MLLLKLLLSLLLLYMLLLLLLLLLLLDKAVVGLHVVFLKPLHGANKHIVELMSRAGGRLLEQYNVQCRHQEPVLVVDDGSVAQHGIKAEFAVRQKHKLLLLLLGEKVR